MALPVRAKYLSPDALLAPANLAFEPLPLLRPRRCEQFLAKRNNLGHDALLDDRSRIDDLGRDTIIAPPRIPIGGHGVTSVQRAASTRRRCNR